MKKAYKQPDLPTSSVGCAAHLHREFFVQGCDVSVHKLDSEAAEKWTVTAEDVAEKS